MENELTIYQTVIDDVKGIISSGIESAYNATSRAMIMTYWNVGRRIVEQEQNGNKRAEYGTALMDVLAAALTKEYGKSYSKRNLQYFRKFYQYFPEYEIVNSCVHNLTWTQYYYRLMQSPKKDAVIAEMKQKNTPVLKKHFELVKSPVIAEFLGFKNEDSYLESDLESAILSHIRDFLMELGRGFAFVARQQHIVTETDEDIARYSVLHDNDRLFMSKYLTYLPTKEQLKQEIERQKEIFYMQHPAQTEKAGAKDE